MQMINHFIFALIILESAVFGNPSRGFFQPRIINGTISSPQPWVVEFNVQYGDEAFHHCGGALLTGKWILTAAHCFFQDDASGKLQIDIETLFVSIGSSKHNSGQKFRVKSAHQHNYRSLPGGAVINDVALIELKSTVPKSLAQYAGLPAKGETYAGTKAQVFGWGLTEHNTVSEVLLVTDIFVDPATDCINAKPDPNIICAFSNHTHSITADGDSGGPLAIKDTKSGVYNVIGVTSYGDSDYTMMAFARVTSHLDWIQNLIKT